MKIACGISYKTLKLWETHNILFTNISRNSTSEKSGYDIWEKIIQTAGEDKQEVVA